MRATPSRWIHLLVLGAFAGLLLAPALAAAQSSEPVTTRHSRHAKAMKKEDFEEHLNTLAKRLKLSDEQKEKVRPILQAERDKMQDMHAQWKGKTMSAEDRASLRKQHEDLQADTENQLSQVLTPEQMTDYKKMRTGHHMKGHKGA